LIGYHIRHQSTTIMETACLCCTLSVPKKGKPGKRLLDRLAGQMKPLSERKLAAMFGKASRRWARNRMAEARQDLVAAIVDNRQGPPYQPDDRTSCHARRS
jgi:hypothetical protein